MRLNSPPASALLLALVASPGSALVFTESNGQIFTPGFAVLDAPQPGTPLGGDTIEVALDVSANGKLQLPPYGADSPSQIFNITLFLYSYETGRNFTISNGTASPDGAALGDIMASEPGSTVKHVKWHWPDCLVGDGPPDAGADSDRGAYNISIRQNFRLNGDDHYTIFDVPIRVTNRIDFTGRNPPCAALDNPLLPPERVDAAAANAAIAGGVLFAPGDATQVEQSSSGRDVGDAAGLGSDDDGRGGLGAAGTLGAPGVLVGLVAACAGFAAWV